MHGDSLASINWIDLISKCVIGYVIISMILKMEKINNQSKKANAIIKFVLHKDTMSRLTPDGTAPISMIPSGDRDCIARYIKEHFSNEERKILEHEGLIETSHSIN